MNDVIILEKRKLTWFLLFIGFCCVFGWIGMNFILLTQYTNWRHFADLSAFLGTLLMCQISSSFYIILGVVAFIWAGRRIKRTAVAKGLIPKSLIPAAILTPLLTVAGMALLLCTPYVYGRARDFVAGPNVVQSSASPDRAFQAYVVDKPSFDGPNHHLYVRDTATGVETFVTNLPEDVDFNQEIIWSPHSDIVVFRTHFRLIAYAPKDAATQEVKLGGDYHWRKNGTFWVDYNDVKKPADIQFPEPGIVTYRLDDIDEPFTMSFQDAQAGAIE